MVGKFGFGGHGEEKADTNYEEVTPGNDEIDEDD